MANVLISGYGAPMGIEEAKKYIDKLITEVYPSLPMDSQNPILFWGSPGIGKTQIVEQLAKEHGLGFVLYGINSMSRVDFRGLPKVVEKDGEYYTVYSKPELLLAIQKTGKKRGIVLLDEINTANEGVKAPLHQLLQLKTIGDNYQLPEGWIIIGTANPPNGCNSSATKFSTTIMTRAKSIELVPDFKQWKKDYAYANGVNQRVISFLNLRTEFFSSNATNSKGQMNTNDYPVNPRVWATFGKEISKFEEAGDKEMVDMLTTGGKGAMYLLEADVAANFMSFCTLYNEYINVEDILDGKQTEYDLGTLDKKWAMTGALLSKLSERCKDDNFADSKKEDAVINTLNFMGKQFEQDVDIISCFVQDMLNTQPVLKTAAKVPLFIKYIEEFSLGMTAKNEISQANAAWKKAGRGRPKKNA